MSNKLTVFVLIAAAYGAYHLFSGPATPKSHIQAVLAKVGPATDGGMEIVDDPGGSDFDVDSLADQGHITVVEFYTDACPACKAMRRYVAYFMRFRHDIVVKMVRMPDRWSVPWAQRQFHLDIGMTPFFRIYDPDGNLLVTDNGLHDNAGVEFRTMMEAVVNRQS
jgi:thiol-disulfide isomerase/thioredoxin